MISFAKVWKSSGMKPARIGRFWHANVGLPYTEEYRKFYENIKSDTSRFTAGQLTALRCVLHAKSWKFMLTLKNQKILGSKFSGLMFAAHTISAQIERRRSFNFYGFHAAYYGHF